MGGWGAGSRAKRGSGGEFAGSGRKSGAGGRGSATVRVVPWERSRGVGNRAGGPEGAAGGGAGGRESDHWQPTATQSRAQRRMWREGRRWGRAACTEGGSGVEGGEEVGRQCVGG